MKQRFLLPIVSGICQHVFRMRPIRIHNEISRGCTVEYPAFVAMWAPQEMNIKLTMTLIDSVERKPVKEEYPN